MRNTIWFDTPDGVRIIGDYVLPEDDILAGAVLLHMMPSTRESFRGFQDMLSQCGVASIAIDLRGHGESTLQKGVEIDYQNFSDAQHQQSIADVIAAAEYLKQYANLQSNQLCVVGASIGANLALAYQVANPAVSLGVLLSPGMDYRGVMIQPLLSRLHNEQRLVLASSRGDAYSYEAISAIAKQRNRNTQSIVCEGNEHGTNLFLDPETHHQLVQEICDWARSL